MMYDASYPRYTRVNALADRETNKKFTSGSWARFKVGANLWYQGRIFYVGRAYISIQTGPHQYINDGDTNGYRSPMERIPIATILEVESFPPMWDDVAHRGGDDR